jgi:hypothetical protein
MRMRVEFLAYEPDAEALGLPPEEFPDGCGLILINGDVKVTRAGSPQDLMKLALGGLHDPQEALQAFPWVALSHPHLWTERPSWTVRKVAQ